MRDCHSRHVALALGVGDQRGGRTVSPPSSPPCRGRWGTARSLHLQSGLLLGLAVTGILVGGCGMGGSAAGASAAATAQAFAAALQAGKFEQAATAFDYVQDARRQNENWDDIPSGQRSQIIKKLQQQKAAELVTLKQRLGDNIKCGAPQGGGVVLTGDAGSLTLELAENGGKWYIVNVW